MKINLWPFLAAASLTLMFLSSCTPTNQVATGGDEQMISAGFSPASIVKQSGKEAPCDYLVLLDDGTWIEPDGIPAEFKKNGLKVWLKYSPSRRPSLCEKGMPAGINDIQKRGR